MFNITNNIELQVKTPEGIKTVVVTYPTTDQWTSRASKIKVISRSLGRGKSETEVNRPEKVNAELFDAIFQSGDELDEYEKSTVIERLSRCELEHSTATGNGYEVTLKVPGGWVKHVVKMPSAKQVNQYRKAAIRVVDARRTQEITINIGAAETLYDAIVEKTEGYAGDVPVIHKSAVVGEVLALLDGDNVEGEIEGF